MIEVEYCAAHGWVKGADGPGVDGYCPHGDHRCSRIEVVPRPVADALAEMLENVYDIGPAQSRVIEEALSKYRETVTKESHEAS